MKGSLLSIAFLASMTMKVLGQGAYIEYKLMVDEKYPGTIKSYFLDGNDRVASVTEMPGMPNGVSIVLLTTKDAPDTTYLINEKKKTFAPLVEDKIDTDFTVVVGADENVDGYNCRHVKVVYRKSNKEIELWETNEMADYGYFRKVKNSYVDDILDKKLMAAGVDGILVKLVLRKGHSRERLDLEKIQRLNIEPDMVSLVGYRRTPPLSRAQQLMQLLQQR